MVTHCPASLCPHLVTHSTLLHSILTWSQSTHPASLCLHLVTHSPPSLCPHLVIRTHPVLTYASLMSLTWSRKHSPHLTRPTCHATSPASLFPSPGHARTLLHSVLTWSRHSQPPSSLSSPVTRTPLTSLFLTLVRTPLASLFLTWARTPSLQYLHGHSPPVLTWSHALFPASTLSSPVPALPLIHYVLTWSTLSITLPRLTLSSTWSGIPPASLCPHLVTHSPHLTLPHLTSCTPPASLCPHLVTHSSAHSVLTWSGLTRPHLVPLPLLHSVLTWSRTPHTQPHSSCTWSHSPAPHFCLTCTHTHPALCLTWSRTPPAHSDHLVPHHPAHSVLTWSHNPPHLTLSSPWSRTPLASFCPHLVTHSPCFTSSLTWSRTHPA
ncbi:hypothetical protein C7M84_025524 [Penaeus vannamei]|uniref:Uncharacterized protein n=1 Tax=Penaeus vannamei TaxID=6689 RepID=A0A3R7MN19_PENVA|nr:hypothetical protein C7M84_025524 [Penaeus vannamei]